MYYETEMSALNKFWCQVVKVEGHCGIIYAGTVAAKAGASSTRRLLSSWTFWFSKVFNLVFKLVLNVRLAQVKCQCIVIRRPTKCWVTSLTTLYGVRVDWILL